MRNFLKSFKEFAMKGNVMDMAVGVIIGGAFTAIVNSLVNDMFMPLLSLLTKGMDFASLGIPLGEGEDAAVFAYGNFIAAVINFILIALVVFLLVKALAGAKDKLSKKEEEEPAPETPKRLCPYCFGEIADEATRCPHCTSVLDKE